MGWQRCARFGDCPKPAAISNVDIAKTPFAVDFDVSAHDGRLWVRFAGRSCSAQYEENCAWTERGTWSELVLKGVSWSGFHDPGTNCVEALGGFRYTAAQVSDYTNVLSANGFNAVRLPLYASGVLDDPLLNDQRCGRLSHTNLKTPIRRYNAALKVVIDELSAVGAFVMLDMHSLHGEANSPTWCGADECNAANEQTLTRAWTKLATSLCASAPNVILADLYNVRSLPGTTLSLAPQPSALHVRMRA